MKRKAISIIKERQEGEYRVILTPKQVAQFCSQDFTILIEQDAGVGVGYSNTNYMDAGAQIVSQEEAWNGCNLILKYKPPLPKEWRFLRPGMHLGAIFHAEGDYELVTELLKSGVTAYSYEFFQNKGDFPLAEPGGEIAGKMAVLYGAYHLQRHLGGSGVLLAGAHGARKAKVVVIGYGNVGSASARLALAMGAEVVVLGRVKEGLERFACTVGGSIRTAVCSREVLKRELQDSDLLIGAILISTYNTEPIVDDDLVKMMPKGSVIVDVTCGYGSGYMPSFDRLTDFEQPVYEKYGVLHCKIDRLPAAVPTTTTEAYATNAYSYLFGLAKAIYEGVADPVSTAGKIISQGQITHPVIQEHMSFYQEVKQS